MANVRQTAVAVVGKAVYQFTRTHAEETVQVVSEVPTTSVRLAMDTVEDAHSVAKIVFAIV